MSKYTFFGTLAVVLVIATGMVTVVSGKIEEQEFLSRALLVEAKVGGARASSSSATSTDPTNRATSSDRGIRANDKEAGKKYKLLTGTVRSISGNSFVLKLGRRKQATVTMMPETRVYDRAWGSVNRSVIVAGHKVSAYGVVTGSGDVLLEARIVRDLNLPVRSEAGERNEHATSSATTTRGR